MYVQFRGEAKPRERSFQWNIHKADWPGVIAPPVPVLCAAMVGASSVKECRRASASILWYASDVPRDY
jgi:hypothetical protein